MGCKQHDGFAGERELESGQKDAGVASRGTRKSSFFHIDHVNGAAKIGTDLVSEIRVLETRRLLGDDLADVVLEARIDGCSGDDGIRNRA